MLKQYKFKILYISKKNNNKTNVLNKKNNHIKFKKKIYHNILKKNKNESLLTNQKKFNATLRIQKNIKKQISNIKKKINNTIKNYHNNLLQKHVEINKILQFLQQYF